MADASTQPALPHGDAVRYSLLLILFAATQFPVTIGAAVLALLGSHHEISYWWLAVPLAAEAVPVVLYARLRELRLALPLR